MSQTQADEVATKEKDEPDPESSPKQPIKPTLEDTGAGDDGDRTPIFESNNLYIIKRLFFFISLYNL